MYIIFKRSLLAGSKKNDVEELLEYQTFRIKGGEVYHSR